MRHLKILGLTILIAMAAAALAGTASATTLTSPAGTQLGKGAVIKGEAVNGVALHNAVGTIECSKASGEGEITDAGSTTETVKGEIFLGTFSNCTNGTVTVKRTGTSEVHTEGTSANGNGTLTSSGAEVKVTMFGFECIYTTFGTDLGKIVGGTPATVQLSASIPRTAGSFFCGSTGNITGKLVATSPSTILID